MENKLVLSPSTDWGSAGILRLSIPICEIRLPNRSKKEDEEKENYVSFGKTEWLETTVTVLLAWITATPHIGTNNLN